MQKFKMMKIEVSVGDFGLIKCHPPTYDFETEMVLKINHKHNQSLYKSEVPVHETADEDLFPKNRVQNYKILLEGNPEPSQIKLATTRKSKEVSIDLSSPLNLKSSGIPSVKSFYSDFYKKGHQINSLYRKQAIKQNVDQTKSELLGFIENSKNSIEVIHHNKLNFIYKSIKPTVKSLAIKEVTDQKTLEPSCNDVKPNIKGKGHNYSKSFQCNTSERNLLPKKHSDSVNANCGIGEGISIAPINTIPIKNIRSFNFNA